MIPTRTDPLTAPIAAQVAAWRMALQSAPADVLAAIAPLCAPAAIKRARLAERDALLIQLACEHAGDAIDVARAIHIDLIRYAAGAWRYDRDRAEPHDPRHTLRHRILVLAGGEVLAVRSLRKLCYHRAVAKKTAGNGHGLVG